MTSPTKTKRTPAQRLAALDAERQRLADQIAAQSNPDRHSALADTLAVIAAYGLTKAELEPALRKRPFVTRTRKVTPAAAAPALVVAAAPERQAAA